MNISNFIIKKSVLALAISATLIGCSYEESSSKKSGTDGQKEEVIQLKDTTDRSVCNTTSTQSDPRGSWQVTQEGYGQSGQSLKLNLVINFDGSIFQVENTCIFNGINSITVQSMSSATYDSTSIAIFSDIRDTKKSSDGKNSCSVSINKGKFNYKFKGACLVITSPGQPDSVLVPNSSF